MSVAVLGAGVALTLVLALSACGTREEPEQVPPTSRIMLEPAPMMEPAPVPDSPAQPTGAPTTLGALAKDTHLARPEIYTGTGQLARGTARAAETVIGEAGQVTLNFANADIREVIDVVLGETLGISYIIDPAVQGTVTARTSQPLERAAVIPALENILALNGAALVRTDGLYRVVTRESAIGSLSRPSVSPTTRDLQQGAGIRIIPLKYASATEVSDLLKPYIGPGSSLNVDTVRNLLIFAGPGSEAVELVEMAKVFDVDWMAGMSFGLFPVEIADAKNMVTELDEIFLLGGESPLAGLVRFVPIERLNAVLAITPQAEYLQQVDTWIARLDRGEEVVGRRIFVYHVANGRAPEMAVMLNEIFQGGGTEADRPPPEASVAPGLVGTEFGTARSTTTPQEAAAEGDEAPREGEARYERGRRTLQRGAGGERLEASADVARISDDTSGIRVIADERINALIVLATPTEYRMIEATVKRLDIPPLQVFIEATIAEVSLNDELRYGLQWFFESGDFAATFSNLTEGVVSSAFPGFSLVADSSNARVILNALTEITDVNVVSSPQLMVLDNQPARLQVGDEVPIATQSSVSVTDSNAPIVNSVDYRDTGVVLEVTPRVNAGGLVTLDISQEVSDVVETTTSDINSPTIQSRQIQSSVAVQSGETVVLGGLIEDDQADGISGVPLLSDIPLFGNLFKVTTKIRLRRELLIFITPKVVSNSEEAREVTEELRRRLRTVAPLELRLRKGNVPQGELENF
jgi:general secretion pathway protein D